MSDPKNPQMVHVIQVPEDDGEATVYVFSTKEQADAFLAKYKARVGDNWYEPIYLDLPLLDDGEAAAIEYTSYGDIDLVDPNEQIDGFAAQVANSTSGPAPTERDWEGDYQATAEQREQAEIEAAEAAAWDPRP